MKLDGERFPAHCRLTDKTADSNDDMMILVVDDHPINRRLLAGNFWDRWYQCKTANDGVDALNVLVNAIDIVLSDVNMPNMDWLSPDAAYPAG